MKDALTACSLPGKEPICIQFMVKVGIPAPLPPAPDSEQLLPMCDFFFFLLCSPNGFSNYETEAQGGRGSRIRGAGSAPRQPGNVTGARLGSGQQLLSGTSEKANEFLEREDKALQKPGEFWVSMGQQTDNPGLVLSRWGQCGEHRLVLLLSCGRQRSKPSCLGLLCLSSQCPAGSRFLTLFVPCLVLSSKLHLLGEVL